MIKKIPLVLIAFILFTGCAGNKTPVATVAVPANAVLDAVEVAQNSLTQLSDSGAVPRAEAVKVMARFREIGVIGQNLSATLRLLSLANTPAAKTENIDKARNYLRQIAAVLNTSLVPISDEATRTRIAGLLTGISDTLLNVSIELGK